MRETFQLLPWPKADRTSVFAQYPLRIPDCTPVARQMAREVMSLPMHPDLSEADQDRIVSASEPRRK